ncbi:MAG: NUDIX domain-containing protein [Eubacterium sp.]|nr:NUDIX domain-containing protein [Eubacterium sp.]
MQYTHFVSVAALVMNGIGEVLLIRSPDRGWEYPGGMVEPGESLEQALCREIKEETGVDVVIKSFAGICKNIQRDVVNIDFICEYIGGKIRTSEESLEVKWVSCEDAQNMVTFPLTKKRLGNMLEHFGNNYCFAFRREPFEVIEDSWF